MVRIPAITDFRAKGTIMGQAGLTAVFGMGTGVTPPVWSPEKWPAGGQAGRPQDSDGVAHDHRGSLASWGARGGTRPFL